MSDEKNLLNSGLDGAQASFLLQLVDVMRGIDPEAEETLVLRVNKEEDDDEITLCFEWVPNEYGPLEVLNGIRN